MTNLSPLMSSRQDMAAGCDALSYFKEAQQNKTNTFPTKCLSGETARLRKRVTMVSSLPLIELAYTDQAKSGLANEKADLHHQVGFSQRALSGRSSES